MRSPGFRLCLRRPVLLALLAAAGVGSASGQEYPSKPIRFIIPYAVGGGTDILGRIVAQRLGERLGQQVLVDNRPGAGSILGSSILAQSNPDGYTMMTANIAHGANPYLHKKLPYDTVRDFVPVTLMAVLPSVLAIHPSVPARSVKEFIAFARANPGKLSYGTAGVGSANHLTMELFKITTKTDIVHVAYKGGGPAMQDLLGGQVKSIFITVPPVLPQVKAGKLLALGISSAQRSSALPDVPTVIEAGVPGFEVYEWQGIVLPRGTPQEIVRRLNKEIVAVLALPEVRSRISGLGAIVVANSPEAFAEHIRKELALWQRVISTAGIRAN
ncbi:MAG: tripartite tricarboxylate transporter substrate binding protein [Betaproteobacteria bacterium]|nr:tripartite tricarboxylate transporter substrate binding protein [Betaproteobacteria bacterium]